MFAETSLEIHGYNGGAVPNSFLHQQDETACLAILFPGYGFTNQAAVLHYTSRLFTERGADVLEVDTEYNKNPGYRALAQADQFRWLYTDAGAALRAGLAQRSYRQVFLVGKSLGTFAVGYLADREREKFHPACIWMTPILGAEVLYAQIQRSQPRSLFIQGTNDQHYQAQRLAELVKVSGGRSLVIEGADHGLEIAGSVERTLRVLEEIVTTVDAFIADTLLSTKS